MLTAILVLIVIWFAVYILYLVCEGAHYGSMTETQRRNFGRSSTPEEVLIKRRRC